MRSPTSFPKTYALAGNDSPFGSVRRLRWEYQPGSELFIVDNDVRGTTLRGTPMIENRAFVVKFTRLLRF